MNADISITTGDIDVSSNASRLHIGHEAFHIAAVDGDLTDNFDGATSIDPDATSPGVANGSTGHVVANSTLMAMVRTFD